MRKILFSLFLSLVVFGFFVPNVGAQDSPPDDKISVDLELTLLSVTDPVSGTVEATVVVKNLSEVKAQAFQVDLEDTDYVSSSLMATNAIGAPYINLDENLVVCALRCSLQPATTMTITVLVKVEDSHRVAERTGKGEHECCDEVEIEAEVRFVGDKYTDPNNSNNEIEFEKEYCDPPTAVTLDTVGFDPQDLTHMPFLVAWLALFFLTFLVLRQLH